MTRSLIVDGTKEVIANGRSVTMHAISKPTDYTHQRIVGYAVTLEDAHLFAAAEEMKGALQSCLEYLRATNPLMIAADMRNTDLRNEASAALSKSEVR